MSNHSEENLLSPLCNFKCQIIYTIIVCKYKICNELALLKIDRQQQIYMFTSVLAKALIVCIRDRAIYCLIFAFYRYIGIGISQGHIQEVCLAVMIGLFLP